MQQIGEITEFIKSSSCFSLSLSSGRVVADGMDYYPLSRFIKMVSEKKGGRTIVVVPNESSALSLFEDLADLSSMPLILLPSDGKQLYSEYSQSRVEFSRKRAQERMIQNKRALIICSLRSFCSPLLSQESLDDMTLSLKCGEKVDFDSLVSTLISSGYFRSPLCNEKGTFTLRGEVCDIFPFDSEDPIRIYSDWDEISKIAYFDPSTQKADKSCRDVNISLLEEGKERDVKLKPIDSFLRENDYFIFHGYERLLTGYSTLEREAKERFNEAYKKNPDVILPNKYLLGFSEFVDGLKNCTIFYDLVESSHYHYNIEPSHSFFGNVTYFKEELKSLLESGWKVIISAKTSNQKERIENILSSFNTEIIISNLESGFIIPDIHLSVIMDNEIFGRKKNIRRASIENVSSSPLDSFVSLSPGDYVVHINHGIGQFEKIERLKGHNERDYIKIRYADDETLYVPIEQADLVQKYIGPDNKEPKLDKMGSQQWSKKKEKAKEDARVLAEELVKLYAKRMQLQGFPFPKDNDWQLEFEASFPFQETPDQNKCIEDVKRDMESDKCMDRLICGDVGYGKTEIAFRAAFKAIMGGKQVAFLAPTVILAEQHYHNFIERIGSFPLKVGLVTRFVSSDKLKKTMNGLKSGDVDIVFGTHKLLSSSVVFKDLGLLVVDEEQRFGVKHKEKIKQMKSNIDSLTLSATPIPRTLYMSLLKVRDMSLLTTAPRERLPIETKIGEFNIGEVVLAINNELKRGGQVFYLHNRVEDMKEIVEMLQALIPTAIIEGANGQMKAEELEDIMHRFIHEGIQVLVSTTIIENGIDIPNVNTIIIDRADRMGLAQMYQLRGRVGRSDKKAYCYLFYPNKLLINDNAMKRLKVISENTELGSGFKVSMKDMEIRGSGNILGKEQSGELEAVGLDLYMKMIEDEIDSLTQSGKSRKNEVYLELDYSGFIPESYIIDPSRKFELYKKIASVKTEGELESLRSETEDRFGPIPDEVENLFSIAEIKIICRELGIFHLKERFGKAEVEFSQVSLIDPSKVVSLVTLSGGRVKLDNKRINVLIMETNSVTLKDKALFILENLRRLK